MLLRLSRFRTGAGLFRSPVPAMRRAFDRTEDSSEELCIAVDVLPGRGDEVVRGRVPPFESWRAYRRLDRCGTRAAPAESLV